MSSDRVKAMRAEMDRRQAFMDAIKRCWVVHGRPENAWDRVHDWDDFYQMGYGAETASDAYSEALRCE